MDALCYGGDWGGGGVLVGIWYAERRGSPVAPGDLKAAIRVSEGLGACGGHRSRPGSVSSHGESIRKEGGVISQTQHPQSAAHHTIPVPQHPPPPTPS